ncbi:MAG: TIGR00266 family protein [Alphaproteobacteria bacterium]|nr:TIGR00266 family protein [Alphaproteobacteria bacterium]
MKWEITGGSAFPLLKFALEKGEGVKSQSGSMVAISDGLKLEGKVDGGIGKAIGRMFSGESFFMQHIVAEARPGWVLLASPVPGGITDIEIKPGQELTVQKNGFLAGTPGIEVSSKVQSLARGFLSGEGFFVVKLTGAGTAFLSTYGAIQAIDIPAGEQVMIDNGHLIAWDSSMKYEITKATSSWFASLTTGSGFVCRFAGPGRVLVQTRNPWGLGGWIYQFLPIPQTTRR